MKEWAETAQTRQGLYRFLGGALLSPTAEHFDTLAAAVHILDRRDLDRFAFSRDWRHFGRHLPVDVVASKLDVQYVRLFASGMSGALSPPTESYYRVPAKGGGIAGFVADLQREYRSMGLLSVDTNEAPDHVSTEFEVMSYLCGLEADAWGEERRELALEVLGLESRFLRSHLVVWIPIFRKRVVAASPGDFYRDLLNAVHAFVVHENDYMQAIRRRMCEA